MGYWAIAGREDALTGWPPHSEAFFTRWKLGSYAEYMRAYREARRNPGDGKHTTREQALRAKIDSQ